MIRRWCSENVRESGAPRVSENYVGVWDLNHFRSQMNDTFAGKWYHQLPSRLVDYNKSHIFMIFEKLFIHS